MASVRSIRRNIARKQAAEENMPLRMAWKLLTGQSLFEAPARPPKAKDAAAKRKKRQKMQKESRKKNQ